MALPASRPSRATAGGPQRLVAVLAVLVAVAGALVAVAAPAAAASPVTPAFPKAIDPYPRHEAETGCDPTAKPGAVSLQALIHATYGARPGSNISRGCTASNSGHEEGRSIDWMLSVHNPAHVASAESFVNWLMADDAHGNRHAMARRLGVSYLIWNSHKLYLWNTAAGWTEYSDCVRVRTDRASDTTCHRDHIHISLSWAGANATTSWYTMAGDPRGHCEVPARLNAPAAPAARGLGFVPLTPARLLDTRTGAGAPRACWLPSGGRVDLQVTGRGGVPASGVAAVVLNVTATDARGPAWVAAYPAGASFGGTSSVNVDAAGTAAALVTVPVGTGGKVSLMAGVSGVDVVADVVGYFPADGTGARYTPMDGRRLLDARVGNLSWTPMAAPVPAGASAVVANVTLDQPSDPGFASLVPGAVTAGHGPSTSSINSRKHSARANRSMMATAGGAISLFNQREARSVVDVTGYFSNGGAAFRPVTPARLVDTRDGQGGVPRLSSARVSTVQVGGRAGVPVGASAAVVTLTMDQATYPAHVTAWAADRAEPATSDLNGDAVRPVANMAIVPLDAQGRANVRLSSGEAHLVVDVLGYFG